MDADSSTEQKTWQVYSFAKINVFSLHLNESREGFCRRGMGRSFYADWLKTEKAQEPQWRVWCEESGGWEYQKQSGEYGRVCKFEDSHRDKTEQCPWYICSRECFSCIEFVVRLGPSGEIETEVSFMFFQYEASSTVLHATKAMDRGDLQ